MHTHTFLNTAAERLYLAGLFLLPTAVLWSAVVPAQSLKMLIAAVAFIGALALLALAAFKRGGVSVPLSWPLLTVWLIPIAYFIATVLNGSFGWSIAGAALDVDTVFFMVLAALAFSVPYYLFESRKDAVRVAYVIGAAAALVALFHVVRLFGGPEVLSFEIITNPLFSPLGKWNDVGIFFGLTAILSLLSLESLRAPLYKYGAIAALVISLFFVALVNFMPVWVMVAVVAVSMVLYRLVIATKEGFSVAAVVVAILAIIAIVFSSSFGTSLGRTFGVEQIEARPSWGSTFTVAQATLAESPLFGTGPNSFLVSWDKYRPTLINESVFWNADFASGVGLIPTALVTTGLVGFLVWVLFFATLLMRAAKTFLFRAASDDDRYTLSLLAFIGGAYVMIMAVVYLPSPQLLLLGFVLLGLFAGLAHRDSGRTMDIQFKERPRLGFVAVLGLSLSLVVSVLAVYGAGTVFASTIAYERAARAAQVEGNFDAGVAYITEATSLYPQDRAYRLATLIHVARVNQVLSTASDSKNQAELQTSFQSALGAAVESGLAAVRFNDQNYRNWQTLATAYQTVVPLNIQGSYEAAVSALETARGLNASMPTIPFQRAQLEAAKGNTSAIREYVESSIALKQDFTPALLLLAQIELDNGNLKAAISRAESASVFEPSNPVLHFQVGVLKFESNDYAGARVAFERAIALASDYSNARYYLGRTFIELGEREQAEVEFREVLRLNPDNTEVQGIVGSLEAGRNPFAPAPEKK